MMVPDTKECIKVPTHGDKCLYGRFTFRCRGHFLGGLDSKCVMNKLNPNYGRCACKAEYVYDQQFDRCQLISGFP
uniref:Uncharacterized protein n=1 Tax=Romanomermis culicivorax TaxID=13658 RepID=A0A915JT97_ROMCU